MIKKGVLLVKKILLGVSSVIMTALIIATVIYYPNSNEIIHAPLDRLNHVQDNEEPQNEPEQPQSERLQPVNADETITYTLQKNSWKFTYNIRNVWINVSSLKNTVSYRRYDRD